jgi:hypothetical protein
MEISFWYYPFLLCFALFNAWLRTIYENNMYMYVHIIKCLSTAALCVRKSAFNLNFLCYFHRKIAGSFTVSPNCWLTMQEKLVKCLKVTLFWDIAPCSLAEIYLRFIAIYYLRHQGDNALERRSIFTRLHGAASQKTFIFMLVPMRTWNLKQYKACMVFALALPCSAFLQWMDWAFWFCMCIWFKMQTW